VLVNDRTKGSTQENIGLADGIYKRVLQEAQVNPTVQKELVGRSVQLQLLARQQ